VAVEEGVHPGVEKAQPQLGPTDAARVQPPGAPGPGYVAHQLCPVELTGDLQVERRFGDIGRLHDPIQATLILRRIPRLQVLKRGLFA
jgi:hypothetical protein